MTAGTGTRQSTRARRPGRIIERPRLIKLLDEADAPVILIVAPAGYGKTTLARQWARTLSGVVWVACTPSHRDVVTFAEDVAAGIDELGGDVSRFVGEYVRARSNPQRAAREIALMLAKRLNDARVQWLIIDDYQELSEAPEVEEMIATIRDRVTCRVLVVSRTLPGWVTTRNRIYNAVVEVGSSELALTEAEVQAVLGLRPELEPLVRRARGWPAVVALAAGLPDVADLEPVQSALHQYVAEELFVSAGEPLQEDLIELALLPDLGEATVTGRFGPSTKRILTDATNLGFLSAESPPTIHPLLREFLLAKLKGPDHAERIRRAVLAALDAAAWNLALDLVLRFGLSDLVDQVLQRAFKPLVRSGRLETLHSFSVRIKSSPEFAPAAVEVIDAEVALREGNFELAAAVAERARAKLLPRHELACRASLVSGRARFFLGAYADSVNAYRAAAEDAMDDQDKMESAFGMATTQAFSEEGDPTPAKDELRLLRHRHPTNLIRYATADLTIQRFTGFAAEIPSAEALEALPLCPDPHARTAFTYSSSYLLCLRAEYRHAAQLLDLLERDVDAFDLDFVRPFAEWMHAFIGLGRRQFGEADRRLQRVEDAAAEQHRRSHGLNARMLRARLMLQTGEAAGATELLQAPIDPSVLPSWRGEHLATQALALACQGSSRDAIALADRAIEASRFAEVKVLAETATAVASVHDGVQSASVAALFTNAKQLRIWDPVICALRASSAFAEVVSTDTNLRPIVHQLVQVAEDSSLARQLQLPTRTHRGPAAVLSPRELEVLGLIARGMRNKEIAIALFVAESTVKVHVRHILEKLGVGSRSAAVARYERTKMTTPNDSPELGQGIPGPDPHVPN